MEQEHDLYRDQKCIDKGAIERREPNFVCHAAITKRQAQKEEADSLVDKVFGGSAELLFASILSDRSLSKDELARLRALVEAQEA
ncbi:MAG: BlaI/MecI/CopY family transcriptional regulator [Acutalibacteraceae bacterium]